jgi:hypothetical protein
VPCFFIHKVMCHCERNEVKRGNLVFAYMTEIQRLPRRDFVTPRNDKEYLYYNNYCLFIKNVMCHCERNIVERGNLVFVFMINMGREIAASWHSHSSQ